MAQEITEHHLRMPFIIYRKHIKYHRGIDQDDIIAEGYLALVKASKDYDSSKVSTKNSEMFSAFAYQRIRWKMLEAAGLASRPYGHAKRWARRVNPSPYNPVWSYTPSWPTLD